jgi:hypothetical protein
MAFLEIVYYNGKKIKRGKKGAKSENFCIFMVKKLYVFITYKGLFYRFFDLFLLI